MKKNIQLFIGGTILALIIGIAFIGPYLPFVDTELNELVVYRDESGLHTSPYPPSEKFPLGSDYYGVDILSKVIMGAKQTLMIVFGTILIRYIVAIPLGIGAYYFKSIKLLLNGLNQLTSSMPPIFFVAVLVGLPMIVYTEIRPFWIMVVIALTEVARIGEILYRTLVEIGKKSFVESGIASGCTKPRLFKNYYWPHLYSHLFTNITFDAGRVLFLLAQLGIAGIFVQQKLRGTMTGLYELHNDSPSWPNMFEDFSQFLGSMRIYEWIPFTTVSVIAVTMVGFYLFGEGLQKLFQNRHKYGNSMDL